MKWKHWDISMERNSFARVYRRALYIAHKPFKLKIQRVKSTKHGEWLLNRLVKVLHLDKQV